MRLAVILAVFSSALSLPIIIYAAQENPKAETNIQKTAELTQKTIDQLIVERLQQLPKFIIQPRATFSEIFKQDAGFTDAVIFAACMVFIGLGVAFVLNVTKKIEISSIAFVYIGTIVIWIFYSMFLHVFAYIFGARRGIEFTIAAYLYVIAFLQPILALILCSLSKFFQREVDFREIMTMALGGSGGGKAIVLARGKLLSGDVALTYHIVAGLLILIYFSIALSQAQQISLLRSFLASFLSFIFWLIAYLVLFIISKFVGIKSIVRLVEG